MSGLTLLLPSKVTVLFFLSEFISFLFLSFLKDLFIYRVLSFRFVSFVISFGILFNLVGCIYLTDCIDCG